jgi:hypothetical protein
LELFQRCNYKVSNYNVNSTVYERNAEVGDWAAIFPVNDGVLYTGTKRLEVAYCENPSLMYPDVSGFKYDPAPERGLAA